MIRPLSAAQQRLFVSLLCRYGPDGLIPVAVVRACDWRIFKGLLTRGLVWTDVNWNYHIGGKRRNNTS